MRQKLHNGYPIYTCSIIIRILCYILGKVYNITPYMDYHPGGWEELMKAAGGEGTQLFDKVRHHELYLSRYNIAGETSSGQTQVVKTSP